MALTGAERRALRVIEEALSAEDPELSLLMGGPGRPGRSRRHARTAVRIHLIVSAVLLVFGLLVADPTLQNGGFLLLFLTPVTWFGVVEVVRRLP